MFLSRGSRMLRRQLSLQSGITRVAASAAASGRYRPQRGFHATSNLKVVKPVLLADIGEGIVECEIIQWFVEPQARVEEFSPLCEVQSDKASVEITSRFAGVVKKLHYEAGEMAKVGKPFVDIDIQGEISQADLDKLTPPTEAPKEDPKPAAPAAPKQNSSSPSHAETQQRKGEQPAAQQSGTPSKPKGPHATLATPAVRHLTKELQVDISDVDGTGKGGRVLKEDIYKFVEARKSGSAQQQQQQQQQQNSSMPASPTHVPGEQIETTVPLTNMQQMMFKTMTRSLNIPHFLYSDEIDFTALTDLRARLNRVLAKPGNQFSATGVTKLSFLPFLIKAMSLSLHQYPILNARVEASENAKPVLVMRSQHNVGVAMDTPQGLLVPVVKDVQSRTVLDIAAELVRLQALAQQGKLAPGDMTGGTITLSNIGNIGGTYLSPVIVDKEVAIMGVGRTRTVPAFDDKDNVVKKQVCNFSWSADHRVVDGATMARAADVVREVVEQPDLMLVHMR